MFGLVSVHAKGHKFSLSGFEIIYITFPTFLLCIQPHCCCIKKISSEIPDNTLKEARNNNFPLIEKNMEI